MMINSLTSRIGLLPTVVQNTRRIGGEYIHQLSQNHGLLKSNALILSSLSLVISRIIISHLSAQKAKGTPEGPHRYREAIKTTIREVLGFTFSFLVLRAVEGSARKMLRVLFKIENKPVGLLSLAINLKNQAKQLWKGHVEPFVPNLATYEGKSDILSFGNSERFSKWRNVIKFFSAQEDHSNDQKMMYNFYRWVPPILGTIPALALSGFWMERFSLNHAQDVVNSINKYFNPHTSTTNANPFQQQATPHFPDSQQRFNQFIAHVQQQKFERGIG